MELSLIANSILLLPFAAVIVWLAYKFVEEKMSPLQKIPSPPGRWPLIGHVFTFLRSNQLEVLRSWSEKYGPMFVSHQGYAVGKGGCLLYIADPELIKFVASNSHKFYRPDFVARNIPSISAGLFASNGKVHARQKRMIGPAFTSKYLKGFLGIFKENVDNLVKLWSTKLKDPVEVHDDLTHLTLDVIGQSAFGYNFNTVLAGESKVSEAVDLVISGMSFRQLMGKTFIPFFEYLPTSENRRIKTAKEIADNTVLDMIKERRKEKKAGIVREKKDLLDVLMDMYDQETNSVMDDEELRSQVFTFMVAGHETTSVALAWTLYELAKNPEIQAKLREEINSVLCDGTELTWDTVENLMYLEKVIKESLRRHPPAHVTGRSPIEDITIGGYLIPKDTVMILPIDSLQRTSKYWPNPDDFDPARFDEEEGRTGVKPYTHIPFGVGSRMCIGYKFALMEMKVILATLMKKFWVSEAPECKVEAVPMLTVRPKGLKLLIGLATQS